MKQIKGLLLCNDEIGSSLFVKNINQLLIDKNVKFETVNFGFDQFNELCQKYDVMLLAPYFSFYYEKYNLIAKQYQIPFLKITIEEYEQKDIAKLVEQILTSLKD